ncbi:Flp family type IVb pilin [Janibacter sp. G56]|uniref:Flp family type IVb pilin n=1 Tax=Janibacter sp. G56 TaxID=3418717 RepID=UPI003D00FB8B
MTRALVNLQSRVHMRLNSEKGATAVEYGLMVALIAIVIITAVALIGTNLEKVFNDVAGKLKGIA